MRTWKLNRGRCIQYRSTWDLLCHVILQSSHEDITHVDPFNSCSLSSISCQKETKYKLTILIQGQEHYSSVVHSRRVEPGLTDKTIRDAWDSGIKPQVLAQDRKPESGFILWTVVGWWQGLTLIPNTATEKWKGRRHEMNSSENRKHVEKRGFKYMHFVSTMHS